MSHTHSVSRAQRKVNAVARAESLTSEHYFHGDTMIIASATTPGKLYIVTPTGCTCTAGAKGLPCKHAERRALLLTPRRTPQTDAEYRKTLDLCDELF